MLFLAVEGVLQVHVETGLLVECTIKLRKNGNFKTVAKQVYQSLADVLKDNDADWDYIVDDAVGVLSKYGKIEVIDP